MNAVNTGGQTRLNAWAMLLSISDLPNKSSLSPILFFSGDSLECRGTYALFGLDITSGVPSSANCPNAYWYGTNGTTGGVCGSSICNSFCEHYNWTCNGFGTSSWGSPNSNTPAGGGPAYASMDDCLTQCGAWNSSWTNMLNGSGVADQPGSNVNGSGCRRYHIQLATTFPAGDPSRQLHCWHANANSTVCTFNGAVTPPSAAFHTSPLFALVVALMMFVTRL